MFESIYIGLTGLGAFSRNLSVIGNNVANLNSPGFKSSQLSFSELVYRNALSQGTDGFGAPLQLGSGVGASGTRILFKQGTLQQTGQDTDIAIDGGGFLVLRGANGNTTYTRDGRLDFDADGFLVSRSTGARVAAFDGGLADFNILGLRTSPPRATSSVRLVDNLSLADVTPAGDGVHDIALTVIDSLGASRALTLHFINNSAAVTGSWLLEVRDAGGAVISNGEVQFNGDGSPAAGFNTHLLTLTTPGAPASLITLDFGAVGGFSGLTNFSTGTTSSAGVGSQDGFAAGSLTSVAFGADGLLTATYSNGQTATGQRLALALFRAPEELVFADNGAFENRTGQEVILGGPRSGAFGAIAPRSLETANVDLAQQFSELIISQRGYQASSQIISTANEMIQQLFDIKAKR